jgi:hypothetical protein
MPSAEGGRSVSGAFQTALMYGEAPGPEGRFFRGSFSTWWASGVWATPARLRATGCPYGARRVECGQPRNRRSRLSTPLWCGQLGCPHGRVLRCACAVLAVCFPGLFFQPPAGAAGGPPVEPCTHGSTPVRRCLVSVFRVALYRHSVSYRIDVEMYICWCVLFGFLQTLDVCVRLHL